MLYFVRVINAGLHVTSRKEIVFIINEFCDLFFQYLNTRAFIGGLETDHQSYLT